MADYRHAVVLILSDLRIQRSPRDTWSVRAFARELLVEWGTARGLTADSCSATDVDAERWDYDRFTGYALEFYGELLPEPEGGYGTRLTGKPTPAGCTMRDREERFEIVVPGTVDDSGELANVR